MNIQTCSIVVGSHVCNANCPFCVSKMTRGTPFENPIINWRNFDKLCKLIDKTDITTVLLTGKGEPTLYPDLISNYLEKLNNRVPFIELQTNGIRLFDLHNLLPYWNFMGLNTICLSVVSHRREYNALIYGGKHYSLEDMIRHLHGIGFMVRLSVMLVKDIIDSMDRFIKLMEFCKTHEVDQITVRPINIPDIRTEENGSIYDWTMANKPSEAFIGELSGELNNNGHRLLDFDYGAVVYDYNGQNVCLSNCLTENSDSDHIRQVIFYPDGKLMYSWQYGGARLL